MADDILDQPLKADELAWMRDICSDGVSVPARGHDSHYWIRRLLATIGSLGPPYDGIEKLYSSEALRVAKYIVEASGNNTGGGEDPVGFIMASHAQAMHERNLAQDEVHELQHTIEVYDAVFEDRELRTRFENVKAILERKGR